MDCKSGASTHHHIPFESRSASLLTITHTDTRASIIFMWHRAIFPAYWWPCTGMAGMDRRNLPFKCQTQFYSQRKLTDMTCLFILTKHFLRVTQFFSFPISGTNLVITCKFTIKFIFVKKKKVMNLAFCGDIKIHYELINIIIWFVWVDGSQHTF